jgi:hypothetical protein
MAFMSQICCSTWFCSTAGCGGGGGGGGPDCIAATCELVEDGTVAVQGGIGAEVVSPLISKVKGCV